MNLLLDPKIPRTPDEPQSGPRRHLLVRLKHRADTRYGAWSQFAQFCLVGTTGMVIDLLCYAALLRAGSALYLARALAIWIAMSWNFWLNRRLTFADALRSRILVQYGRFCATCAIGALISWTVSVTLPSVVPWFEQALLAAAVIGILAGTMSNFLISRHWVFTTDTGRERQP